jgi:site-specific recombinase XerD
VDEFDIHNRRKNLERAIVKVKSSEISANNKKLIMDFLDECSSNGLSIDRLLFYLNKLYKIAQFLEKDLNKATKQDIKDLLRKIELNPKYSEWTKSNYRVTLKKFYQWLEGYEEGYPEKVRWIKTGIKKNKNKLTNLPTDDEIKKLIEAAQSVRDKALISVLYESGCRIGELLNLRLKDLEFDDYGAIILVKGKTGPRRIRLISSVPRLSVWIEHHPRKQDPESPLWVNIGTSNHNQAMMYLTVRKMLKQVAERTGLRKPVNPHVFRKARATHLASKLTEAQMCEYFGWIQGSDMPSTYVHLSGRDIDNAILRIHGKLPKENKKEQMLGTKKCPRCFYENPPEVQFCLRCRLPLDEKTAIEFEKRKREFIAGVITPEIIEKMIEERVRQILKEKKELHRATYHSSSK